MTKASQNVIPSSRLSLTIRAAASARPPYLSATLFRFTRVAAVVAVEAIKFHLLHPEADY